MVSDSKRSGFRFQIQRTLKYIANGKEATAQLVNISTSGLYVKDATLPLTVDDEILIVNDLERKEHPEILEAKVVRAEQNEFSVVFLSQDGGEDNKNLFLKMLARSAKKRQ